MATRRAPRTGTLTVVGTGITLARQTTLEALDHIKTAEKLFYLVTEPATALWLRQLNPTAQTLDDLYRAGKPRAVTYRQMTARILKAVRAGLRVVVAAYGHPGIFVQATHAAIAQARREGFAAKMLPGISAQDCLVADLGVNPGDYGCQIFEATNFLAVRRRFDPTSELILFQIGVLGEASTKATPRPERLAALVRSLRKAYPARHPVVLYHASPFAGFDPLIQRIRLEQLPRTQIWPMSTLYVPPLPQRSADKRILGWLAER